MGKSIKINDQLTGFHAQEGVVITGITDFQKLILDNEDIEDLIKFLHLHKSLNDREFCKQGKIVKEPCKHLWRKTLGSVGYVCKYCGDTTKTEAK